MAEKQNNPQLPQNTSNIDTDVFVKGMTKDPNTSLVGKEQWTHARNAINNSAEGDVGTLGNEPANLACGEIPSGALDISTQGVSTKGANLSASQLISLGIISS